LEVLGCDEIEIIYFYHPDYLGSVEFITDMRGEPYQFFLNTPWGENLENQYAKSYTSFSSRFRFNGKEWDEETGNFYYGARYYDPKMSVWLSVDPLAHKLPHLTPYCFSNNNPVNMVDPDGRLPQAAIGFIIGFALDVSAQMLFDGRDLTAVDYMSATISGGAGMLSCGISSVAKFGKYGTGAINTTIDVAESQSKQAIDPETNGEISLGKTVSDVVSGAVGNKVKVVDANIKVKENTLDRSQRLVSGDFSSSGRARNVQKAQSSLNNAHNANGAAGRSTGNVLQSISDDVRSFLGGSTGLENFTPSYNTGAVQDNARAVIIIDPSLL
jgi:RHS repeat-associated protein